METVHFIILSVQKLSTIGAESNSDAPALCSAIDLLCDYASRVIDDIERERHG